MENFDSVPIAFNENSAFLLNILIAFIMFGIALDLRVSNFTYVIKNLKLIWIGLFCQFIFLPLFTFFLVLLVRPHPSLALGLILVAACPGGNVSNFAVHIAKANTALSITLTSIATILATFATPVNFALFTAFLQDSVAREGVNDISLSVIEMCKIIFLITIVPTVAGMLVQKYFTTFANKIKKGINILSFTIFFGFIAVGLLSNIEAVKAYFGAVIGLVVGHNLTVLVAAFLLSTYFFKLQPFNAEAITLETGMQNTGIAFVIIFNFLEGNPGMLLIAAFWGIWHLISGLLSALLFRKRKERLLTDLNTERR